MRRPVRRIATVSAVAIIASALVFPTAAIAAVDTPFTFDDPAPATSGVVQYSASGATVTTLTGTGPDGATVRIETIDAGTFAFGYPCSTTVVNGAWSCDVTLGSFVGTVGAQRMEDVGGLSLPAETISRTIVALSPPAFDSASTGVVSSSTSPTISGTVTPLAGTTSATVRLTVEGDEVCIATVAMAGTWTCSISVAGALDGPLDLAVTQTRTAGGVSGTSLAATTTYTLDTTGPTVPATFTTPAGSTLTVGPGAFVLAGTAEASGTVRVTAGATTVCGPLTVSVGGTWSCTATGLPVGSYTLSIVHADARGNASSSTSESIALTVQSVIVIPPPNLIISPPSFVTLPNLNIAPPAVPTTIITDLPGQLIEVSTALATDSPARDILQDILVTNVQGLFEAVDDRGLTYRYAVPINQLPDLNMRLALSRMFPDGLTDVNVIDPSTGLTGPRPPTWSDMPWRAQVVFLFADYRPPTTDEDPFNQGLANSIAPFADASGRNARTVLNEGEILIDQQELTGDGDVTLSGSLPEGVEPGDYDLIVRVVLEPDENVGIPVPDTIEPIEVSVPVTLVADEPAAAAGVSPWLWAGIAAVVLGIVAIVVIMARTTRRRA
ncbi:Ig-like domain-containing protein [Microcella humidisoli]|uniref:Ig-like domain-containing protein n=1 Tax=Microcella humidisoli TaxID=2963406 RepID=A0ABY5FTU2_9MICO|nr:Ig-like domain-containing protein [Microcella humidisoli]UTT61663.1 Ig-like domain-containing protein [Microcella humidisoli]